MSLKLINIGLYSDIYRPISFKLAMMIGTTKIYISMSFWMTLSFIQGTVVREIKNFGVDFVFRNVAVESVLKKFSVFPQSVGLLKLVLTAPKGDNKQSSRC